MESKQLARKGRCKLRFRVRTPAEMAIVDPEPWHVVYGGRSTEKILVHTHYMEMTELVFPDDSISLTPEYFERIVQHDWIDTDGMLRSYCKCCDARGEWDRNLMAYVAIDPEPAETKPEPKIHFVDENAKLASDLFKSFYVPQSAWTFPVAKASKP